MSCEEPTESENLDEAARERDQKQRGYYYDDAHGYEIYDPDEHDDEEDEEK